MNILYLSSDNRCRSILAEAITRHVSEGLVSAYSAGLKPDSAIYPAVYGFLRGRDIQTLELQAKSIEEVLSTVDSASLDIVVSLSADIDKGELKKKFLHSEIVNFPLDDISHSSASDEALHAYFDNIVSTIEFRLRDAIVASESAATAHHGRKIVNKEQFINSFCRIATDRPGEQQTD